MQTALSGVRGEILRALSEQDIDKVSATLTSNEDSTGIAEVSRDRDALDSHFRRLLHSGRQKLEALLQSEDIVAVWHGIAEFDGTSHFTAELRAVRKHYRKLVHATRAELRAMATRLNAIEMSEAIRRLDVVKADLAVELSALKSRKDRITELATTFGDASNRTAYASQSVSVSAEARAAREEMTIALSASNTAVMDHVVRKYSDRAGQALLGEDGEVPLQKLRTRQVALRSAPLSKDYSGLQALQEKNTGVGLAKASAERKVKAEAARRHKVEAQIHQEEERVEDLHEQIRKMKARVASGGASSSASRSRSAARGVRKCFVCLREVPVVPELGGSEDFYHQHTQACLHDAVEYARSQQRSRSSLRH